MEALDTLKKNFELQFEPVFSGVFELKDQSTRSDDGEDFAIGFSTEKKLKYSVKHKEKKFKNYGRFYQGSHDPKKFIEILMKGSKDELTINYRNIFFISHGKFLKKMYKLLLSELKGDETISPEQEFKPVNLDCLKISFVRNHQRGGFRYPSFRLRKKSERGIQSQLTQPLSPSIDLSPVASSPGSPVNKPNYRICKVEHFISHTWKGKELWETENNNNQDNNQDNFSIVIMRHCPACHNTMSISAVKSTLSKREKRLSGIISNVTIYNRSFI